MIASVLHPAKRGIIIFPVATLRSSLRAGARLSKPVLLANCGAFTACCAAAAPVRENRPARKKLHDGVSRQFSHNRSRAGHGAREAVSGAREGLSGAGQALAAPHEQHVPGLGGLVAPVLRERVLLS